MKVPRDLSGAQLVKILCRDWSYRVVHQEGNHIICKPTRQRINGCQCRTITHCALAR